MVGGPIDINKLFGFISTNTLPSVPLIEIPPSLLNVTKLFFETGNVSETVIPSSVWMKNKGSSNILSILLFILLTRHCKLFKQCNKSFVPWIWYGLDIICNYIYIL